MCMNCGCGELNERHGKDSNITADDLVQAARSNGQDVNQTVQNMEDSLQKVGGGMSSYGTGNDASRSTGRDQGSGEYR